MDGSLRDEIHQATRFQHTDLNRRVTHRLHFCLPHSTETLQTYAIGIAAFASIYNAFEQAWQDTFATNGKTVNTVSSEREDTRLLRLLQRLHMPDLVRGKKLREDLHRLGYPALPSGNANDEAARISNYIRTSIFEKPHLVFAYVWIMYMAIFSGGRWIRVQLIERYNFTCGENMAEKDIRNAPLSFWFFGSSIEVEDTLKKSFLERFNATSIELTSSEYRDIVLQSQEIFKMCDRLIHALDSDFADAGFSTPTASPIGPMQSLWTWVRNSKPSVVLSGWGPPRWLWSDAPAQ